jgi:hypothetical protein
MAPMTSSQAGSPEFNPRHNDIKKAVRALDMAEVGECLHSKHKILSKTSIIPKKNLSIYLSIYLSQ